MAKQKPKYKLRVQIGKKPKKGKVYRFDTDDPAKDLNTIKIPKMMEEVFFTLWEGEKKAERSMNALLARRIFNNKLNAFYFIKSLKWIFK